MIAPKLRFSEFKNEWNIKQISELATLNPKSDKLPNQFIYIDLESVENGTLISQKLINLDDAPSRAQRKLEVKDVLFQMVRPYQQNNFFFDMHGNYVASTGYIQIRTDKNNPKFIYYVIHTKKFLNNILLRCTGSNYPAINSSDFAEIEISYPPTEEQTKIAEFLSAVDDKISQLSRQLQLLNEYKKGVMQKIFSQEIRFKNDNGEDFGVWKTKFIKDLRLYISDGNYGELYPTSSQFVKQGIAFIRANNIKHLKIVDDDMRFIDRELHKILTSGHLKEDDILVTTRGDIGTLAIVENNYVGANINAQICLLRVIDTNQIYARYLLYFLASSFGQKQFKELETGTALKQLPKKNLDKILVNLPCIEEQKKIAEFLTAIDERIDHTTAQLTHTKQWKKGLLQQMFV